MNKPNQVRRSSEIPDIPYVGWQYVGFQGGSGLEYSVAQGEGLTVEVRCIRCVGLLGWVKPGEHSIYAHDLCRAGEIDIVTGERIE